MNKQQKQPINSDPWPNIYRVWVNGELIGDVTIADKRRIEARCRANHIPFKAEYIGRNVGSGRKRLYEM